MKTLEELSKIDLSILNETQLDQFEIDLEFAFIFEMED